LVALREDGESSYYRGMYIDDNGVLQRVDPTMGRQNLEPSCACCTHTFNGAPFTKNR
jgi:hypothetical protein